MAHLWGIDMGGTKIEGVVLRSAEDPDVIVRHRLPTLADEGYEVILGQVKTLVETLTESVGRFPDHIGMGTPGISIPTTGTMKNSNADALNGRHLRADLENHLGTKVTLANDAHCFALAEASMGAAKKNHPDAKVVFGVIMGTGVGGGLVVNGQIITGLHGVGGEWGHNFLLEGEGRGCYCGKNGCNENILSGPSLEWFYERNSGKALGMRQIVDAARSGIDEIAQRTMERLFENAARALSTLVNIIDPDLIVIGGGVGKIDRLYPEVANRIAKYVFNDTCETPIVKPLLGDSAGVYGAAFLTYKK